MKTRCVSEGSVIRAWRRSGLCLLPILLGLTAAAADRPFECTLTADRTNYTIGEIPKFTFRILNNSGKAVMLVELLDGSLDGRRSPKCDLEILDAAGKPVKDIVLLCGNMNKLRTKDFVLVPPGEAFYPFGKEFVPARERFRVKEPGQYTVRFSYSTSEQLQDYLGDEREGGKPLEAEISRLFQQVPKLSLTSNALKLNFTAKAQR